MAAPHPNHSHAAAAIGLWARLLSEVRSQPVSSRFSDNEEKLSRILAGFPTADTEDVQAVDVFSSAKMTEKYTLRYDEFKYLTSAVRGLA